MNISVVNAVFVSRWIFRWRMVMNRYLLYYIEHWTRLRRIQGLCQRGQEDTMRFAQIMEGLGVNFIDSIMTLIAFMSVLIQLSTHITHLPLLGEIKHCD